MTGLLLLRPDGGVRPRAPSPPVVDRPASAAPAPGIVPTCSDPMISAVDDHEVYRDGLHVGQEACAVVVDNVELVGLGRRDCDGKHQSTPYDGGGVHLLGLGVPGAASSSASSGSSSDSGIPPSPGAP